MSPQESFEQTLISLHEAALNDARWPAAASLINETTGISGSIIVCGAGRFQAEADLFLVRLSFRDQRGIEWQRWYFEEHWLADESVPRIARLPYGQLVHITETYTDDEMRTSSAYNEARREAKMQNGLNVRLPGPGGSNIVWSIADPEEPDGWTSEPIGAIKALAPHVRQFVCVRQALAEADALGGSLTAMLDNASVGVIQLGKDARILAANDRARGHLRQRDALCDSRGSLRARIPTVDVKLQRLLQRALPPFGVPAVAGSMAIKRSPTGPKLMVHVHPVASQAKDIQLQPVATLVLIVDPAHRPRIDPGHVAAALDLTPAESELAVRLAAGDTLRQIAVATNRTEGTMRWHLKQIFRKQGISRQADLVRSVLSLGGFPAGVDQSSEV